MVRRFARRKTEDSRRNEKGRREVTVFVSPGHGQTARQIRSGFLEDGVSHLGKAFLLCLRLRTR